MYNYAYINLRDTARVMNINNTDNVNNKSDGYCTLITLKG
jgi:hypothetical protein